MSPIVIGALDMGVALLAGHSAAGVTAAAGCLACRRFVVESPVARAAADAAGASP